MVTDEKNTGYIPLAERMRQQQGPTILGAEEPQFLEETSPVEEPQFLEETPPADVGTASNQEYIPLAERIERPVDGSQEPFAPLEEEKPSFGSLVERSVVTAAETFNSPFKMVGRSIWNIGQRLGDPDSDAEMPEFLVDQRSRLDPAETTAERAVDVFSETAGATLSMLMPTNAAAQLYARSAGMSRISTKIADDAAAASAAPYERGIPHKSLFDKAVNKQDAALAARQAARTKAAEATGRQPGLATRTARRIQDLPAGLARAGQSISQAPQAIARSYIDEPGKNFAIEAVSAIGAGAGAGLMEAAFPGSFTARSVGTIAGGFSPAAMAIRGGSSGVNALRNVVKSFSSEERHKLKLAKLFTEAADDTLKAKGKEPTPEAIQAWREGLLNRLAEQDIDNFDLTPGMQTGDDVVLGFESAVARSNIQYKGYREEKLKTAFDTLDTFISGAFRSDDMNTLQEAASLRYAADKNKIEKVLQEAQRHAAEVINSKLDFTPEGKAQASQRVREIIFDVFDEATKAEKRGWNLFAGKQNPFEDGPNPFARSLAAKNKIQGEVTETRPMPFKSDFNTMEASVRYNRELGRIRRDPEIGEEERAELISQLKKKTPKKVKNYTVKNMSNLRRDLLDEARELRNKGQANRARMHSELAQGILDDMDALPSLQVDRAYQRAAAFSKAKNDAFNESFVSKVLAQDERGAPKMNPETVLQNALGSVGSRSPERRLRLQQLESAADFDPAQTARPVDGEVETFGFNARALGPRVVGEEEAFLRASLADLVDGDGNVSRTRLDNFLKDPENQQILNRPEMSALQRDLQDIRTAQARVRDAQGQAKLDLETVETTAFANMAGDIHPSKAIRTIMSSNKKAISSKIKDLAKEARQYDTEEGTDNAALNGLLRGLIDYAFDRAGITLTEAGERVGNVSFTRLKQALEEPVSTGSPSIEKLVKSNRLMTETEWKDYMRLVNLGADLESRATSPEVLESLEGSINAGTDLAIRIIGSNLGSRVGQMVPGSAGSSGLVEASAGVRTTRSVFEKMPLQKLKELQRKAAEDKEFLQDVLLADYTPANRGPIRGRINLFLIEAGIVSLEDMREFYDPNFDPQQAREEGDFSRFDQ